MEAILLLMEMCFVTDKILQDNKMSVEDLKEIFRLSMNLDLVLIPSNLSDKLSHADGYLSFLSQNNICLSSYPIDLPFLKGNLKYLDSVRQILSDNNMEITIIHDRPVDEYVVGSGATENDDPKNCLPTARGIFVNFLILNNTIILPEYSLPNYKRSFDHNQINKETLVNMGYNVITINCDELAKQGGSLHCCTFTN